MPKLKKELKGDLSMQGLIKRWHVIENEQMTTRVPLRVALERHEVEHRLMGLL